MLITSSTPRITYKIGMRAGLSAAADKSLPWPSSGAPSIEVAADFTGIYGILMWRGVGIGGKREILRYQSTTQRDRCARGWAESTPTDGPGPRDFALGAAGPQV